MNRDRKRVDLFNVLGRVSAALSLLHLLRDLTPLELFSLGKEWVDAYAALVRQVITFLFGWLQWRWFDITENEGHIIVIAGIVWAAVMRADMRANRLEDVEFFRNWPRVLAYAFVVTLGMAIGLGPVIAIEILMPEPYSVFVGGVFSAVFAGPFFLPMRRKGSSKLTVKDAWNELAAVVSVVMVILLLNYTLLAP